MREALRNVPPGNASSLHAEGRAARAALDRARDKVAAALGARRTEITFTSSGTEAVNLGLFGIRTRGRIVTWAAEHQSVLAAARRLQASGREVVIASVDKVARVDADAIAPGTNLVSVGLANNEVGTVQPVEEIIRRAHDVGALVHVDACAGPRWIPIPEGADLASFSGHKLGAGRGGFLYVRDGVRVDPLFFGGPQEWGRRAGHEDVATALAVATALSVCARAREAHARA
ncbi:MAG TPA: aminotransferase class V-fold PLP-dependent enzyme, partial [Candidatus Dormibacteraeota bacterium]|nr:aminotransferase class V-fold PLP-dependent enzyme [Candidatus Dormibacteraeota bacterium]